VVIFEKFYKILIFETRELENCESRVVEETRSIKFVVISFQQQNIQKLFEDFLL